ncbi:MAG: D-alanine--D-alanine ligase [Planctomycetes bacterium]|nr:D-alanine--D-alanine ligase [Planctomycetota bacterium]
MDKKALKDLFVKKKAVITVLMGGFSSEREISLKSGSAVSLALKSLGYKVLDIDVTAPDIPQLKNPDFDIAFIALHGKFGEDGGIQLLLEEKGIVYTGSGVQASRDAMDKFATKELFERHDVPTAPYRRINKENWRTEFRKWPLGFPVVIKPRAEGSSVGVSIIKEPVEIKPALDEAFKYGKDVVAEQYISGREVTVGVLGDKVLPVIELKPKQAFYDYKAKYQDASTEYIVNPNFPEKAIEEIQSAGLAAYKALDCRGAARVDIIYSDKEGAIVLEVNTIPGLTERSLLPKAAKAIGIDFPQLCERIILASLE